MSFDLAWTHHYCLACDRQTEGEPYCSESCRLSDNDRSTGSSPGPDLSSFRWPSSPTTRQASASTAASTSRPKFYLSPAYDFSHAEPYGSTPRPQSMMYGRPPIAGLAAPSLETTSFSRLTPSSSRTSLASMQSASSTSSNTSSRQPQQQRQSSARTSSATKPESLAQLPEKTRQELRAYAMSFENGRLHRRRSY